MRLLIILTVFLSSTSYAAPIPAPTNSWQVLNTVAYKGKQDDIFFVDNQTGWYVNGEGFIYHSTDGGKSWTAQIHKPGTFFRSINFIDKNHGFAGNIGPDYFPGVSDAQPLYQTTDGGLHWSAVKEVTGADIKGICAMDSMTTDFINAGHLDHRTTIYAAGRVGGPAKLVISRDAGQTWKKYDLSKYTAMILDVKFLNESTGFICAGNNADVDKGHAQILKTIDGGTTWKSVYVSKGLVEVAWKCSFPTDKVGYATILNFNPESKQKLVAKTTDGGETWQELPLVQDGKAEEFGVAFLNENVGWVGATDGIWHTADGGQHWNHEDAGHFINKIRVVKNGSGATVFAIGKEVLKQDVKAQP